MQAVLDRLLAAIVLVVAVESGAACRGLCATTQAAEAAGPSEEAEAAEPETDTSSDAGAASEASDQAAEPTCMLDVFRQLKVGDWVRTRWSNKEEHTLLVAARTDEQITIEEIVQDRGFRKAWTQLDVSLADGTLLALRERLADGTIEAREPSAESQRGTSDLLVERFRPDGREELKLGAIIVYADGEKRDEKRGLFLCRRYRITVEENRYAHLWFSRVKLPDYPVRIHYYEEHLTIQLEAFGTGRASEFSTSADASGAHRSESQ
jgi:hypothetical protein